MPFDDMRCAICGMLNPKLPHYCAGAPDLSNLSPDDGCRPMRHLIEADVRRIVQEETRRLSVCSPIK